MVGGLLAEQFGQAEIGDFHPSALVDEDVFRLDVAMDHALVMGELKGIADLRNNRQGLLGVYSAGLDSVAKKFTPSTNSMTK